MSDETGFNPEFMKGIKGFEKISEAYKRIDTPLYNTLYNPIHDFTRVEDIIHQNDFLQDVELAHNPTYDLIEKQEEANGLLNKIVENTSVLKELVEINRETQLKTEELTYVMRAIYEVAKANSKEESDTLFAEALKVINESGEAAGNIASLTSLLMGIYTTVNTMI